MPSFEIDARLAVGMTGEGVDTVDNEEVADKFSSANPIRSSKISSDSPVETLMENPDSASELMLLLFPTSFQPLFAEVVGVEE